MTVAILLAAGSSTRYGRNKLMEDVGGSPLWLRSYHCLKDHPLVGEVGIVASGEVLQAAREMEGVLFAVEGGESRQESALRGLQALGDRGEIVLIHDAARPFASRDLIDRVIMGVQAHGAAFPALPVTDTIKEMGDEGAKTLDRSRLLAVQTPQGGLRHLMVMAHAESYGEYTDDMAMLEAVGVKPHPVAGDPANIKVTHPGDLSRKDLDATMEHRTGFGYDIHRFSADPARPLWLGGVLFEGEGPGLDGHSDADALLHAVTDAVLGAAGLGDIGQLFPNTDMEWKDARSHLFLEEAARRAKAEGWRISYVDCTVVAERPKVMKKRAEVCAAIAAALGIGEDRVSIKATTNEGLGSIGRGEGIAAMAVATLAR